MEMSTEEMKDKMETAIAKKIHAVDDLQKFKGNTYHYLVNLLEELRLIQLALNRKEPKLNVALHKLDVIQDETKDMLKKVE